MTTRPLLTLLAATCLCTAAFAQERITSSTAATASHRAGAAEPTRANEATAPESSAAAGSRVSAHSIPMGISSSFGGVSSTMSPTLEGAVGSGTRIPGTKSARKVCPPGLQNRDGNCAPPIDDIMRP